MKPPAFTGGGSLPWISSPSTYEAASHADGPKVHAWLQEHGHLELVYVHGSSISRRLRAWRQGECPSFATLDRVLLVLDVLTGDLPADVWIYRRRPMRRG